MLHMSLAKPGLTSTCAEYDPLSTYINLHAPKLVLITVTW